jgi:hypothetical protein
MEQMDFRWYLVEHLPQLVARHMVTLALVVRAAAAMLANYLNYS